jgi:hypothetical protein
MGDIYSDIPDDLTMLHYINIFENDNPFEVIAIKNQFPNITKRQTTAFLLKYWNSPSKKLPIILNHISLSITVSSCDKRHTTEVKKMCNVCDRKFWFKCPFKSFTGEFDKWLYEFGCVPLRFPPNEICLSISLLNHKYIEIIDEFLPTLKYTSPRGCKVRITQSNYANFLSASLVASPRFVRKAEKIRQCIFCTRNHKTSEHRCYLCGSTGKKSHKPADCPMNPSR